MEQEEVLQEGNKMTNWDPVENFTGRFVYTAVGRQSKTFRYTFKENKKLRTLNSRKIQGETTFDSAVI